MAFISEIHYLNTVATASGVAEFVEVTLTPAEALRASDFQIATYEQDGGLSDIITLSDLTPTIDPDTGFAVYVFETVTTAPDGVDGNAEAIALVDNSLANPVISFFDIAQGVANIEAVDGPAAGATSVNIPGAGTSDTIQFDINGNRIDGDLSPGTSVVCFANGTMIETERGFVPIETLQAGDRISTMDAGPQPIRWISSRKISHLEMLANPNLRPVILPGTTKLKVSRHHRMLICGKIAQKMFGQDEILVPAKDLVGYCGVEMDASAQGVTYFHILLDDHHIINANGISAESLYLGKEGVNAMVPAARKELETILPELADPSDFVPPELCRRQDSGRRVRNLARRHQNNKRELLTPFETA
ncbi:MAG: Hint domain-containing protein [Litoreibacter sp.]